MKRSHRLQFLAHHWWAGFLVLLVAAAATSTMWWPQPAAAATCRAREHPSLQAVRLPTGTITATTASLATNPIYNIIGWNDLGMHCMNDSFANSKSVRRTPSGTRAAMWAARF